MLAVAQLVKTTIYSGQAGRIVKVTFQILNRCRFACRLRQPGLDKFSEYFILYSIESYLVKHPVKNQIRTICRYGGDARKHLLGTGQLCFAFPALFSEKIRTRMSSPLFIIYPFPAFLHQFLLFLGTMGYTCRGQPLHLSTSLFYNDNANVIWTVSFLSYKHISCACVRHPESSVAKLQDILY